MGGEGAGAGGGTEAGRGGRRGGPAGGFGNTAAASGRAPSAVAAGDGNYGRAFALGLKENPALAAVPGGLAVNALSVAHEAFGGDTGRSAAPGGSAAGGGDGGNGTLGAPGTPTPPATPDTPAATTVTDPTDAALQRRRAAQARAPVSRTQGGSGSLAYKELLGL